MPEAAIPRPGEPTPVPRVVLCPYCGEVSRDSARCDACRGNFDPLSRQATQNSMGPWFIRDPASPHRPGCSFEILRTLAARGKIEPATVVRGPTTNQFWSPARRAPGVANLLGICHNCAGPAGADDVACLSCGATFRYHEDRQHLGLTEVRLLPGHASPEAIAAGEQLRRPSAGVTARPQAPRASVSPGPSVPSGTMWTEGPAKAEPAPGRGLPVWIFVLAGMAVVAAGVAAAWIMDALPGFPSPIHGGPALPADEPANSPSVALPGDPAAEAPAAAGPDAPGPVGGPEGKPADEVTGPAAAAPGSDRIAEARRLLAEGSEDSLRQALIQAVGEDPGAVAIRRAAERLLGQRAIRGLP